MHRCLLVLLTLHCGLVNAASPSLEASKLLELHNTSRQSGLACGWFLERKAPQLVWSEALAYAAEQQVRAMAAKKHLNHKAGGSTRKRLHKVGYHWRRYAENIAYGYNSPEAVFDGWKRSKPHCQNILDPDQTEIGAAHYQGYWSVILAQPQFRKTAN